MSTYQRVTKNPITGKFELATWLDDYFGPHRYGVRFPSEIRDTYDASLRDWEFEDDKPTQPDMKTFPTWKTITLGRHRTPGGYRDALRANGVEISHWGDEILAKVECSPTERNVELVLATGGELGMTEVYTISELRKSAEALGLSVCPAEVGPALREQYADQPTGAWALVLMDPVLDSDSNLKVFDVDRDSDGTYLNTYDANPGGQFFLGSRWVVCRPAASSQTSDVKLSQSLNPKPSLVPGSERWNFLASIYFQAKHMQSSDGIIFLNKYVKDDSDV